MPKAYSIRPPPTIVASASPAAVAAVVVDEARAALPRALNSTAAAVAAVSARPTPAPISARPAYTQPTEGAIANRRTPTSRAPTPYSIVARRPM